MAWRGLVDSVDSEFYGLGQKNFNKHRDGNRATQVMRAAFNLALHKLGVIEYNGPAADILARKGVDFDAAFQSFRATVAVRFRRAGFVVAESSVAGGNRPGESAGTKDGRGKARMLSLSVV